MKSYLVILILLLGMFIGMSLNLNVCNNNVIIGIEKNINVVGGDLNGNK